MSAVSTRSIEEAGSELAAALVARERAERQLVTWAMLTNDVKFEDAVRWVEADEKAHQAGLKLKSRVKGMRDE